MCGAGAALRHGKAVRRVTGTEVLIRTALPGGGGADVAGTLTPAGDGPAGWCAVIGIPGATHDGSYFDCPVPGYSLAGHLASAGLAFLALDRLGTGGSAPVPASTASLDADAAAGAAAAAWARRRFGHVVLLGHGIGGMIATSAAARLTAAGQAQPDLLVLTGTAHAPGAWPDPAALAPAARKGWVTARDPAWRQRLLHGPDADPAVLAWDTGTALSSRQFVEARGWAAAVAGQGPCAQVTAPVLLVAGQDDPLLGGLAADAGRLAGAERPHYPRAASVAAHVVPGAAHCLTLGPSAAASLAAIAAGILAAVPSPVTAPAAPGG